MAAVAQGPLPFDNSPPKERIAAEPDDAVIFFGVSLVLGIAARHLLTGTKVPYTVALLVLGIALGSLEFGTSHGLGKLGAGVRLWAKINPDLLLSVFLPALLFESSFAMEVHRIKEATIYVLSYPLNPNPGIRSWGYLVSAPGDIQTMIKETIKETGPVWSMSPVQETYTNRTGPEPIYDSEYDQPLSPEVERCMVQMLLLAGPGVIISTFFLGSALKLMFPYGWNWKTSLLLGGLLSATDPVAVVALLKELGASKKLSTIIEGESLMNDGTAIVVYQLFYQMVLGRSFSTGGVIKFLSQVFFFGIASVLWLGFIFNDTVIEIALTLAVSYIAFFTAQDGVDVSGVLTVMTLGMFLAAVARTAFKGDSQQSLHHFWEMVAYIANTLIFILRKGTLGSIKVGSGRWNAARRQRSKGLFQNVKGTLGSIKVGPGRWNAARRQRSKGLFQNVDNLEQSYLKADVGTMFVFFTGGIVFLTLIINGSTVQFFLHILGMDKLSATKIRILNYTRYEMLNKAVEAFGDLGDDEELGPADWPTVQKYITCLKDLGDEQEHPHDISESENHLHTMNLRDIRVRLLNGVQAAYWGMLEEGRIDQGTATLLMRSVDEAMDVISSEPLCDWKGLKSHVHFPSYYRFLQMSRLPRKLVTHFTVDRLESACYICAAFLRAHRTARRQLQDFIGDSEIASRIINESSAEEGEARKFLEDVHVTFPQVIRVVKTKQVTYSILKHLGDYVQNLQKVGLLEEKEMLHLDDVIQTDLKKLLRNPPLVRMPRVKDLLSVHPLLGSLPSSIREQLERSTKETTKICGITLYKEGSKPNGIWLISVGVVKWASNSLKNRHSLHPTFSHESTLGLYEVLIGKPYICDMITDSVVHCFFIETEKILTLLQSDPVIGDFLWQESSIYLAKIFLPQIFEKMTMQELRGLVAERSTMNTYIRGEVIEIKSNSVAYLLEGFIKTQDASLDLITSPAALLPSNIDLSFAGIDASGITNASFCHRGSCYQVETRARVICFNISTVEGYNTLQKRAPSTVSLSGEPLRTLSKEHGLLSWPEHQYRARGLNLSTNEVGKESTSLSVKAMELSIYGSMVNVMRRRQKSFQHTSQAKSAHSLSYPGVPSCSNAVRPLLSVQSEGGSTNRKLGSRAYSKLAPNPPLPVRRRKIRTQDDDSSEESGGEEVIVRIDSPSTLSFHQTSGRMLPPPSQ